MIGTYSMKFACAADRAAQLHVLPHPPNRTRLSRRSPRRLERGARP